MLVVKVYSNDEPCGYLDKDKWDITENISNAMIFDDKEIEDVKYTDERFADCFDSDEEYWIECKVARWEVKETLL
jgi:hypothetical protein